MSVNKVILVGRLGNDPEVREIQSGKIANLSLATSETWKDKSGERQERTEWHRVVIYNGNLAGLAETYLHKGDQVYIEGSIRTRKYEKDGAERYTTEIVLGQFDGVMRFLAKAGDGKAESKAQAPSKAAKPKQSAEPIDTLDDEIPF